MKVYLFLPDRFWCSDMKTLMSNPIVVSCLLLLNAVLGVWLMLYMLPVLYCIWSYTVMVNSELHLKRKLKAVLASEESSSRRAELEVTCRRDPSALERLYVECAVDFFRSAVNRTDKTDPVLRDLRCSVILMKKKCRSLCRKFDLNRVVVNKLRREIGLYEEILKRIT